MKKNVRCGIILFRYIGKYKKIKFSKNIKFDYDNLIYLIDNIEFMCVQRKNSYAYVDFINGKYNDALELFDLLNNMTIDERLSILNSKNFMKLYIAAYGKNIFIKSMYDKGKNKFEKIITSEYSMSLDNFKNGNINFSEIAENEWGFPKGSCDKGDKNYYDCATRELYEETGINKDDYVRVIDNPIIEEFTGTDGKIYTNIYYICFYNNDKFLDRQNIEIRKMDWLSYEEIIYKIPKFRLRTINTTITLLSNIITYESLE